MPASTRAKFGIRSWVLRCAYVIAFLAILAMGWLAATGVLTALVFDHVKLSSAPPMFRSFIDLIWYGQMAVVLAMLCVSLYLVVRPRWWGKLLCALGGLSWTGFCLIGLAQGLFD